MFWIDFIALAYHVQGYDMMYMDETFSVLAIFFFKIKITSFTFITMNPNTFFSSIFITFISIPSHLFGSAVKIFLFGISFIR